MLELPLLRAGAEAVAFPESIEQILRAVRKHLGMEVGFVAEFSADRRVFRHVDADGDSPIAPGDSDPLNESYCHWIAEGQLPQLIQDPADHPLTKRFAATTTLPVGAHLSVPIRLRDGRTYGTFCCFSRRPDRSLTERDMATMRAFADLAAQQIQLQTDMEAAQRAKQARIRSVLATRGLDIHFQPAVRIDTPQVAFVEALARFRPEPNRSPDEWFAEAHAVGLGVELELMAARQALGHLAGFPPGTALSINMSPAALISERTLALLAPAPLNRLIIEVTEHSAVERYGELLAALAPLRKRGLRLAVDDAGAGYASLKHVLQMSPDIIKLDMSLSRDIHRDPARKALAAAMIHFAAAIGSELVAEGVESPRELQSLRELGITIVQGHLFARPGPPADVQLDLASAA